MTFDSSFWLQVIVYIASFGYMYGKFKTKLDYLEKKMDKHNQLQERMAIVEQSTKSAHRRLDELKEDIREEINHED